MVCENIINTMSVELSILQAVLMLAVLFEVFFIIRCVLVLELLRNEEKMTGNFLRGNLIIKEMNPQRLCHCERLLYNRGKKSHHTFKGD